MVVSDENRIIFNLRPAERRTMMNIYKKENCFRSRFDITQSQLSLIIFSFLRLHSDEIELRCVHTRTRTMFHGNDAREMGDAHKYLEINSHTTQLR